jgi:ADP-ribose pyrophosphatase YjhB (NUDIX family)
MREIDDRAREVCTACGTVFYDNPLPVAASVLLNENREVLLVKRKNHPHAGMWCLPTGFAELGETIDEAALRELQEETGVEGVIHRLLTAHSLDDVFYGDLLFICFEITRTGGEEAPGDDAEELAYFPLLEVPPLAWEAHTEAVRMCESLHREPWAIRDSFANLYAEGNEEMLSDPLVYLVEERADEICERWLEEVRTNPTTASYGRFDREVAKEASLEALSRFSTWLMEKDHGEQAEAFYLDVGRKRAEQGFQLAEVISALTLLRREVWAYARERQVLASPLDVYRVMELTRRIVLFFDKAVYHATEGFFAAAEGREG